MKPSHDSGCNLLSFVVPDSSSEAASLLAQGHEQTSERLGASQNQLSSTDSPHHSQCPATFTRQCMAAHARKFSASADLYKQQRCSVVVVVVVVLHPSSCHFYSRSELSRL